MGFNYSSQPLVTVVRLQGVITPSTTPVRGPAARRVINLERAEKWLKLAFNPLLKQRAVAIAINSPGGAAAQADLLHRAIRSHAEKTRLPVYTFTEDVAASGGYWLMCAGDKIFACNTSLVGSIGVVNAGFGAQELIKKLGIERRLFTAGEEKALLDPFKPVEPKDAQRVQELLNDVHNSFKDLVKQSRGSKLSGDEKELFSGRVWTGRQAVKLGLVDQIDDMHTALRREFGREVQFLQCSPSATPGFADMFFGGSSNLRARFATPDVYSAARSATQAFLDEVDERTLMARYGL
ncbi:hypothetical protein WJX72_001873 [[Myrmecia] bisecta]|uniref:Peptidase S49 domain-containing protein n=1 Tax=[Myrmecia] bisecta TaxID=41462 RepID=A0AAW1QEC2_9CHLO